MMRGFIKTIWNKTKLTVLQTRLLGNVETINSQSITVIEKDSAGNVLRGTGTVTVTNGGSGYAKGCFYIKTNAGAGVEGVFRNVGTTTSCTFEALDTISASEIALPDADFLVGNSSNVAVAVTPSGDIAFTNTGVATISNDAVSSAKLDEKTIQYAEFALTEANIIAMNTTPVEVLVAQGAGKVIEFLSAIAIYDFDTAAYTGGGDVTFESTGGATVSSTISSAESFGASGDKVTKCQALGTAGGITLPVNTGISITNATAVFADPGTAQGVGRIKIAYRVHTTGL